MAGLAGGIEVTKANYALRLQASLKSEAERVAKAEGTTLNQFINVAVAEKLSALRTADYFQERAARADIGQALELLDRAGDESPREGDEVVAGRRARRRSRRSVSTARRRR
jgi:hypothetical protein